MYIHTYNTYIYIYIYIYKYNWLAGNDYPIKRSTRLRDTTSLSGSQ